ncbi:hypothetical protein MYK68_18445 [Gordonia sp. PP30]|uniref:hypothetical protein n=1 Tax=Gordonia sp. PP30 TaxID=2935861 RepID=UPI001FFF2A8F|nr:hypothetical protein [Gordonia sp. PP30]UQE74665.1 hypothetical protein MYK68_18445 [Gordonia sp. PP30]
MRIAAGSRYRHDEGVDQHRRRQAEPQDLQVRQARGGHRGQHDGDQDGRGADHPAGRREADLDGLLAAASGGSLLGDPGQDEHLVVHRQPVGDAEEQDRGGHVDRAERGEAAEQPGEVPFGEDEHQ